MLRRPSARTTKNGVRVGAIGDIGCFSFFPSKNLGAFGDAGLCTTNDADLAESMRVLRVHGGKPKYFHAVIGGNFRIDELQAAVLARQAEVPGRMDRRPAAQRRRTTMQRLPSANFAEQVGARRTSWAADTFSINTWCACERRDALKDFLTERGIGTEIYYPVPLHLQKCFEYLKHRAGDFPRIRAWPPLETLALPIYPELTQHSSTHVVASIAEFYR